MINVKVGNDQEMVQSEIKCPIQKPRWEIIIHTLNNIENRQTGSKTKMTKSILKA